MTVPVGGEFRMFSGSEVVPDFESIAGAITSHGGNIDGLDQFTDLIWSSETDLFDPTYAGNISSLANITSSLQYRNYPSTPTPTPTPTSTPTPTPTGTPTPTPTITPTPTPTPTLTPTPSPPDIACGDGWQSLDTSNQQPGAYPVKALDNTAPNLGNTFQWAAFERPNRFVIYDSTGPIYDSDWVGYANYPGQWGSSLNTASTGNVTINFNSSTGRTLAIYYGQCENPGGLPCLNDSAQFLFTCGPTPTPTPTPSPTPTPILLNESFSNADDPNGYANSGLASIDLTLCNTEIYFIKDNLNNIVVGDIAYESTSFNDWDGANLWYGVSSVCNNLPTHIFQIDNSGEVIGIASPGTLTPTPTPTPGPTPTPTPDPYFYYTISKCTDPSVTTNIRYLSTLNIGSSVSYNGECYKVEANSVSNTNDITATYINCAACLPTPTPTPTPPPALFYSCDDGWKTQALQTSGAGNVSSRDNNYGTYPIYSVDATDGYNATLRWVAFERPNRFIISDSTGIIYDSGWVGYANYPFATPPFGWGNSLNTASTGQANFTWGSTSNREIRIKYGPCENISGQSPCLNDAAEWRIDCD